MDLSTLKHVRRYPGNGSMVLALDTGALINAESEAMIQALHSRSVGGVEAHLKKLQTVGAEKFMGTFYIGYGHKSIGDCGSVTLFIEGVSMLVAKAIQDFMLYNGQEASTRYIDFATQKFLDVEESQKTNNILEQWRTFYLKGTTRMRHELLRRHPQQEGERPEIYDKAITARAFDIMRGFLPAGATTNLAWHGELRHVSDHLDRLRFHPLREVQMIAWGLEDALAEMYPSSFQKKRYEKTEKYLDEYMRDSYYFNDESCKFAWETGAILTSENMNERMLQEHAHLFHSRPAQTELPKFVAECGTLQFSYLLDFGSFRDDQRHRAVIQRMPLLTPDYGFEPWYLEQLPEDLRKEAERLIASQMAQISRCAMTQVTRQYYLPMGMRVACRKTGDLPALVYLVERRARLDVHPTMRNVAQRIGNKLIELFGEKYGLHLYMETSGDRFHYKRGQQDIVEK